MRSKDYVIPYRPIISAPPTKQWSFTQTLLHNDKKVPIANLTAFVPRKAFCPGKIKIWVEKNKQILTYNR